MSFDIINIVVTIVAALVSGIIGKYGLNLFNADFWSTQKILVHGSFKTIGHLKGNENEASSGREMVQDLLNGELKIRGGKVVLKGMFKGVVNNKVEVEGTFMASGVFRNGQAYLSYEIRDIERRQFPCGILMLYISDWGQIDGYYCVKPIAYDGKTAIGYCQLTRGAKL